MTEKYRPEGCLAEKPEMKEQISSLACLEYALSAGAILESTAVLCDAKHNLIVELGKYKGIIPRAEASYSIDGSETRDIAIITRVGKPVCFKVLSVDKSSDEPLILLSRREAQAECFENYVSKLSPGDVIDARVTHIESFGCFCDVGCGIISLLPVDCISVSRISNPKERFCSGDLIKCAVKTNDRTTGRISLTHKELLGTWEENASLFSPGETAAGIIRSIEPYGIFVELMPNLAGLAEWCEGAETGHAAAVYIKSIVPSKMKIKLVIIDSNVPPATVLKKPEYVIDSGRIEKWVYSPPGCEKYIYTDFTEET
ncbi:MAG: 30S ribosomal protein S1 [Clostridia bacterium]|nr:30S ribosomal protein S1 [Clostridia bacterium]